MGVYFMLAEKENMTKMGFIPWYEIGNTVKYGSLLHAITVKENKLSEMGVYSMLIEKTRYSQV